MAESGLEPRSTGSKASMSCSESKCPIRFYLVPTMGHQHPLRRRGERGPAIQGSTHMAAELVLLRDSVWPHCILILYFEKIM